MKDHVVILDQEIEKIISSIGSELEVSIFLFGSFLLNENSGDIDLLIVYADGFYEKIKELKREISLHLQNIFRLPIHFTTLAISEAECLNKMADMCEHMVYSNVK